MALELLDALFKAQVDEGTIEFLLETLASLLDQEDVDYENEVVPLIESLVPDPSAALKVLQQANDPKIVVETAQEELASRQKKEEREEETNSNSPSNNNEAFTTTTPRLLREQTQYTAIPGAHNRAISLRQLQDIYEYVQAQVVDDGSGTLPWTDQIGKKLTLGKMNVYHLVDYVIKPLTASFQCSIVEILATGPQKPQWFVSHAWGEPICDFLKSLLEHARVRGLDMNNTLYWICAFSNNQHKLEEDSITANNSPTISETSFYRALQQCEGMLLCLDEVGTPFDRIWCCFEQSMLDRNRLLLDIATVHSSKEDIARAVVITDGRSTVTSDLVQGPKFALEFKRDRERSFPLALLEEGYAIDIRQAKATREEDRRSILNTIIAAAAITETNNTNVDDHHDAAQRQPNLSDPSFLKINQVLRGIFAEAAARKAAEQGRIDQVVKILKQDCDRAVLTLNLGGSKYLDTSALTNLAGHTSLRQLTVDCCYSNLSSMVGIAECIGGLLRLETLDLSFEFCTGLEDISQLSQTGLASLRNLTDLRLNFHGCDVEVVLTQIEQVQSLKTLSIDFSRTQTKANSKALLGILQLTNLWDLELLFNECRDFRHLNVMKNIGQCSKLERVVLDFSYVRLTDVNELGALTKLKHLRQCNLAFTKCSAITAIPWLVDLVSHGTELDIDLSECKGLDTVLQRHFQSRQALQKVLVGNHDNSSLPTLDNSGDEAGEFNLFTGKIPCWRIGRIFCQGLEEAMAACDGDQSGE